MITITAPGTCNWTASSPVGWLSLTPGSGNGNGTINYTVAANPSPEARTTTLTVAGQSFIIAQAGNGGTCAITPISPGQAINGALTISDCSTPRPNSTFHSDRYSFTGTAGQRVALWLTSSDFDAYLLLLGPTGTVLQENDDADRSNARVPDTGFYTLPATGIYVVEVTSYRGNPGAYTLQFSTATANCSYTASSANLNFAVGGGNGSATITTNGGCAWQTTSNVDWLTVTSGPTGSGAGTVNFSVAPNPGVTRLGKLFLAGQVLNIVQAGNGFGAGGSWGPLTSGTTNQLNSVYFSNDEQGYVAGANATLRTSSDQGQSWNAIDTGVAATTNFHTVRASGQFSLWVGGERATALTSDGGASWGRVLSDTGTRRRLFPINSTDAWVVGDAQNQGAHFFTYILPFFGIGSETLQQNTPDVLNDVYFFTSDDGWSVGNNGRIIRISKAAAPGTAVFTTQTSGTTQPLNAVFVLNLNVCWAVGNNGTILRTLNGGTTWTQQTNLNTAHLRDVHFTDIDHGWAVGDGGVILVTSNGGQTWTSETSGVTGNLNSVFFTPNGTGFAVGNGGVLLKRAQCSYAIAPSSAQVAASATTGQVTVTTTANCAWTATSNASWLTITSGATGSGSGTVSYSVAANSTTAQRVGTLSIAGQTFTVTQAAAPGNPVPTIASLSPNTQAAGSVGFNLIVNGTNFVNGAVARWNGENRTTTFISASQLSVQILRSDLMTPSAPSVTVFNPAPGGGTSNASTFTITLATTTRIVRVSPFSAAPGSTVSLPVELVAQGNERALSFSLNFDTAVLSNAQLTAGTDVGNAQFNVNTSQVAQGRLGAALTFPPGQQFQAGTKQLAKLTVTIAPGTAASAATISFGDQPVTRDVTDANAVELQANFTAGTLSITPGFEGDVSPRPTGNNNGQITIADAVQVGRFVAGLDSAAQGSEFQRADIAPRNTLGDGRLSIIDWTQAGRFAAGLDAISPAGGPAVPAGSSLSAACLPTMNCGTNTARDDVAARASVVRAFTTTESELVQTVQIALDAQGGEQALGFSLQFDAARWRFLSAETGADASAATVLVNMRQTQHGQLGLALAMPAGQRISAGTRQLLTLRFAARKAQSVAPLAVSFGDFPVAREIADVTAQPLPAFYVTTASEKSLAVRQDNAGASNTNYLNRNRRHQNTRRFNIPMNLGVLALSCANVVCSDLELGLFGDDLFHDFRSAAADGVQARITPGATNRVFGRISESAHDLHAVVHDFLVEVAAKQLGHGDFAHGVLSAIDQVERPVTKPFGGFDAGQMFGEFVPPDLK